MRGQRGNLIQEHCGFKHSIELFDTVRRTSWSRTRSAMYRLVVRATYTVLISRRSNKVDFR